MGFLTKLLRPDTAFSIKEFDLESMSLFKGKLTQEELKFIDNSCIFINSIINDYEKKFKSLGSMLYKQRFDSRFLAKSEFELSVFILNAFLIEMKSKNTPLMIRSGIRYRIGINALREFSDEIAKGPYSVVDRPISSFDNLTKERGALFTTIMSNQDLEHVIDDLSEFYAPILTNIPFYKVSGDSTKNDMLLAGVTVENLQDRRIITDYLSDIMGRYSEIFRNIVP